MDAETPSYDAIIPANVRYDENLVSVGLVITTLLIYTM